MQFYLLFPIFAVIVWKLKPSLKIFFYSLLAIGIGSLVLSVLASSWKPVAAFYLLPTRGWELAAGGIVYFLSNQQLTAKRQQGFYLAGLALWLIGFFIIDANLAWPSGWALLPVVGTGLIILAAKQTSWLMHNPVAQWLGKNSYSVYLWHWPLVVGLYFADLQTNWLWVAGFFILSLILGELSYRLIENPTRKGLIKLSFAKQFLSFAVLAGVIGVSAVSVRLFTFEGRLPAAVEIAAKEAENKDPRRSECFEKAEAGKNTGCVYGADEIGVVLMGDSHAASTITAVGLAAKKHNLGTLFYGRSSCLTIDGVIAANKTGKETIACRDLNEWAFKKISNLPKHIPVVTVSRTSTYLVGPNEPDRQSEIENISVHFGKAYKYRSDPEYIKEFQNALISTACRVAKERPFYLMRPVPEYGTSIPKDLTRNMIFKNNYSDIKITLDEYHKRNKLIWAAQDEAAEKCGVKILNPLPYLCDETYCYGSKNGRPLYYDDDHLSEYGNKFLVPMFEEVFKDNN